MTATLTDRTAMFLRRAGLLAVLAAIIAGIVGMHILTGSHTMHMAGSSAASQSHHGVLANATAQTHHPAQPGEVAGEHPSHAGYPGQGNGNRDNAPMVTVGAFNPDDPAPASGVFSCMGGDPCAGMSSVGGSCIPSGSTGSLAVRPPSTVSFAADTQAPGTAVSSYAYLPESRSPADLCISRT